MIRSVADSKSLDKWDRLQAYSTPYRALPGPYNVSNVTRKWKLAYQLLKRAEVGYNCYAVHQKQPTDEEQNFADIESQQASTSHAVTPKRNVSFWSIWNMFSRASEHLIPSSDVLRVTVQKDAAVNLAENQRLTPYVNHASELLLPDPL